MISGANRGIGHAITEKLLAEGYRLSLGVRSPKKLPEALRSEGKEQVLVHAYDALDGNSAKAWVHATAGHFGQIDGLVNNAGWDVARDFLDTDLDLWRKVIEINLIGPLIVTRAVLSRMQARGRGRVVSIASDAGRVGSSGESVYAACKGGIIAFSKSVARELARTGITLNLVSPGPTDTPLFANFDETGRLAKALERAIPMGRLGQPADYPGLIAFLLSDDAAFITGQTISVSGGLTMHG